MRGSSGTTAQDANEVVAMINVMATNKVRTSPRKRSSPFAHAHGSPKKRTKASAVSHTIEIAATQPGLKRKSRERQSIHRLKLNRQDVYEVPADERAKECGDNGEVLGGEREAEEGESVGERGNGGGRAEEEDTVENEKRITRHTKKIILKRAERLPHALSMVELGRVELPPESPSKDSPAKRTRIRTNRPISGSGIHPAEETVRAKRGRPKNITQKSVVEIVKSNRPLVEDTESHHSSHTSVIVTPEISPKKSRKPAGKSASQNPGEQKIRQALDGIEAVASLHGCTHEWGIMLVAARYNSSTVSQCETSTVKRFVQTVSKAGKTYEAIFQAAVTNSDSPYHAFPDLQAVKAKCMELSGTQVSATDPKLNLVNDIYVLGIPSLVTLLRKMITARFVNQNLDSEALGEISEILKLAHDLCNTAFHWRPRPSTLDSGVLEGTKNAIASSLDKIRKRYEEAKNSLDRPKVEQAWKDELARRRKDNIEKKRLWEEQKRAELLEREKQWQLRGLRDGSNGKNGITSKYKVLDVDDVDLEEASTTSIAALPQTPNGNSHTELPERPRPHREPTEDIPGPAQSKWREEEEVALLNGLQEFTEPDDRFFKILEAYGSHLRRRDLGELVQQAKFWKQSMAGELKKGKSSWGWLRSVPD